MNLGVLNDALLLKHVNKFLNKMDIPWASLIWNSYCHNGVPQNTTPCGSYWWKDICDLVDKFTTISWAQVN